MRPLTNYGSIRIPLVGLVKVAPLDPLDLGGFGQRVTSESDEREQIKITLTYFLRKYYY